MTGDCGGYIYKVDPPHHCPVPVADCGETVLDQLGTIWECCCGEIWVVGYGYYFYEREWRIWEPRPKNKPADWDEKQAAKVLEEAAGKVREEAAGKKRWWKR